MTVDNHMSLFVVNVTVAASVATGVANTVTTLPLPAPNSPPPPAHQHHQHHHPRASPSPPPPPSPPTPGSIHAPEAEGWAIHDGNAEEAAPSRTEESLQSNFAGLGT